MDLTLPESIDLGDVHLRFFAASDDGALADALVSSHDHLHPWMSWATPEAGTREACRDFIEGTWQRRAAATDVEYGIFAGPAGAEGYAPVVLGGCGVHARVGPGAVEIGYWLHVAATGRGLMTRVIGTLTDQVLALEGIERVEIHVDAANHPSAGVPRRLGYTLVEVRPTVRPGGPAGSGQHQIWAHGPDVDALSLPRNGRRAGETPG